MNIDIIYNAIDSIDDTGIRIGIQENQAGISS